MIGFKSYKTRQQWFENAAQIDLQIQKRGVRTLSGKSSFRFFDGPTMVGYQVPHRTMENVYCRGQPTPSACLVGEYDYDPTVPNVPASSFEVKQSGAGEDAGRGVFTKVDIPGNAYLSAETNVHTVDFMPSTVDLIQALAEEDDAEAVAIFIWYMVSAWRMWWCSENVCTRVPKGAEKRVGNRAWLHRFCSQSGLLFLLS